MAGAWSAACREPETVRRALKDGGETAAAAPAPAPMAAAGPEKEPEPAQKEKPGPSLLAEDDIDVAVSAGQMRKTAFLAALRVEICAAVDEAMSGTGRDSKGCPWIDHWLGYYESRSAAQVERSLIRYAPQARGAATARDYIQAVTARVRRSARTFARTGEITGVPDDMPGGASVGGGMLAAFGGMFFKARPGGARQANPVSVREQLGEGQELPGAVRDRMESAFGTSFSAVRLHADSKGAELSERLNARAFTVGRHVAFGPGEFRPGTLAGDALIAHELAHVVQQNAARTPGTSTREEAVEKDANHSASAVVESLWSRTSQSATTARRKAGPRLRSGLSLSRCGKSEREKEVERLGDLQYGYLEEKRKAAELQAKKDADEDAKKKGLEPPKEAPKVELADVVKKDVGEHALKGSPTTAWDTADQPAWKKRAADAWKRVKESVKGTELEPIVKKTTFNFDPAAALKGGFYASQNGHTLTVGMSWVTYAEQDPKNVWENLAHEMGGHLEYGTTYAAEIMNAALSKLSGAERKKVVGERQKFFETYEYPETEIYASVWQRRYRVPEDGSKEPPSGGIHPDANIVKRLKVMKDALHPDVAKAVLVELKRRIDLNSQILQRDKDFFVAKVKEIMGYDL